jgi:hypothetical protein
MLSLIAFWISSFDKLPTSVVVSVFVVAVGFVGGVVADVVADGVGDPDEPCSEVAEVTGAVDEAGVVVAFAPADDSGCLTEGSGPQPRAHAERTPRQTHSKPKKRMPRVHAKSAVASTGKTFVV